MSTNENIKKMFEREFDKELMKQRILDKERKKNMNLKTLYKWSVASFCLVAIISGIVLSNHKELKSNQYEPSIESKNHVCMYINNVQEMSQGTLKFNAEVKRIDVENLPYFKEIENINLPNDFDTKQASAIYIDSDKEESQTLQSYVFNYSNTKKNRYIRVSFSKENKPIRDYYFPEDGSKMSKINNIELKIFKYNELYFTEFHYKNINFDIETTNITEQELTNLLLSILK